MTQQKHTLNERMTVALGLALEEIHNPGTARVAGYDLTEMIESLIRESTKTHGVPQMITDETHRRARIAQASSPLALDAMIADGFRGGRHEPEKGRYGTWTQKSTKTVMHATREHEARADKDAFARVRLTKDNRSMVRERISRIPLAGSRTATVY